MIAELPLSPAEEYELVNKCRSGDIEARDRLVLSCSTLYVSQGRRWSSFCKMDADDLASEFRIQTMKAAPFIQWKSSDYQFRLFVFGVCRCKAMNLARMLRSRIEIINPDDGYVDPPERQTYLDYREEFEEIRNCLRFFTEQERAYFLAKFDLDTMEVRLSKDVAADLNVTYWKYQYHLKSSINILKDHISKNFDDWGFDLTSSIRPSRCASEKS